MSTNEGPGYALILFPGHAYTKGLGMRLCRYQVMWPSGDP